MALVEILKSTGFEQVGDIVDYRGNIEEAVAEGVIRVLDADPRIVAVEPTVEDGVEDIVEDVIEDAPPADVVGDVEESKEPVAEEEVKEPEVVADVEGEDK